MFRGDALLHAGEEHSREAQTDESLAGRIEPGMLPDAAIFRRRHEFYERRSGFAGGAIGHCRPAINDVQLDTRWQWSDNCHALNVCDLARTINAYRLAPLPRVARRPRAQACARSSSPLPPRFRVAPLLYPCVYRSGFCRAWRARSSVRTASPHKISPSWKYPVGAHLV